MKTALVTGATSGIGREVTLKLAESGWRVLIHGRDAAKVNNICASCPASAPLVADLSSIAENKALAQQVRSGVEKLDALILNAGAVTRKRVVTKEGIEYMFAVNHLSPFVLTKELSSHIADQGSILNVSTEAHRWINNINLSNLQAEKKFRVLKHYAATKAANLIAGYDWVNRLKEQNINLTFHHPGEVATNFGLHGPWWLRLFWKLRSSKFISPGEAAQNLVGSLESPRSADSNSIYFVDGKPTPPAGYVNSKELRQSIVDLSSQLVE